MAKTKKWQHIQHEEFDGLPIAPEIYAAIGELREWQKNFAAADVDKTTTYLYITDVLAKAIWKDVGNIIANLNGPKIPALVECDFTTIVDIALNVATLPMLSKTPNKKSEVNIMVATLSKCVCARCKLVRERILLEPPDWWLRLAINDVTKNYVKSITESKADSV